MVRRDRHWQTLADTFGGRLALTVPDSQSGFLAPLRHLMGVVGEFPPYREVIAPRVTPLGAMSAVIDGTADVAPIDSYALCLLKKYRLDLTSQIRTVARTEPTPIPPLVASGPGLEPLQAAFLDAHRVPSLQPLMEGLLLERFVTPDPRSYDVLRVNFEATTRYWRTHKLAAAIHPSFR